MGDSYDDMEALSGFIDDIDDDSDYEDFVIKRHAVLEYCEPHLEQMWASRVVGILLGCDFRDAKEHLKHYYEWAETEGL